MNAFPQTPRPEVVKAFDIILERLYAMARQMDPARQSSSDLEDTLVALPAERRPQVMLVLESVESRAQARADDELAEAARAVRNAANRAWRTRSSAMCD